MSYDPIVHHMVKVPDKETWVIGRVTPLTRLGHYGEVVILQAGKFWSDGGPELELADLPGWVYDAMSKMSPAALKEVGFAACPVPPQGTAIPVEVAPQQQMWTCPQCEKPMDISAKDAHVAKHNRRRGFSDQLRV